MALPPRSTLTRALVVTALLGVLPFSGIRVVCVELPAEAPEPAAQARELTECERLCPLHASSDAPSSATETEKTETREGCALSSDPTALDCASFSVIAVVGPQAPPQVPPTAATFSVESRRVHLEPAIAPAGPPPKPSAL